MARSGKGNCCSLRSKNQSEVKKKSLFRERAKEETPLPLQESPLLKEAVSLWQKANIHRYKGATALKYENLINNHILPVLGECPLSALNTGLLADFMNNKLRHGRVDHTGGLSPSYVRSIMLVILEIMDTPESGAAVTKEIAVSVNPEEEKLIGETVGGKYTVLKLLGTGGYCAVYLVIDKRLNKMWAMKTFNKKDHRTNLYVRDIILTEAQMMLGLNHPAIPLIVDIIEDDDNLFILREYIEGETLESLVAQQGAQSADIVIEWGKQLCDALGYLHSRNLIYRDMKPANVILRPNGTLKIVDFGIMRTYKPNQAGDTCCLGTRGYAAPEQFGGSQTDARTDIFGLGMTMFRLVTGVNPTQPPYEIKPIREVNPNLPEGLEYIISKCIMPNPKDRYQSCNELMVALNNYLILPRRKGLFGKIFGKK